ncbi:unnamed protein product [Sphenostylis stenocarpa]|uniref:Myosin motor domain-containing protein n=1 Tax=Sphenostylis stenocarpa TaxID=92480 RepID=A0AA86SQB0_9FABA|nr:unnamed protein product [Sphenostylis stenocarpa]
MKNIGSIYRMLLTFSYETITKWLDPEATALSRDALAKIVYSRLFEWLVDKINNSIGQDPKSKSLIGVLDIYGFESFKANRFVTYQTEFFLDKNKDYVVAEDQALLYASKCPFVSGLFPPSPEESSKQSKFSSIGSRFKVGLFGEIFTTTLLHHLSNL